MFIGHGCKAWSGNMFVRMFVHWEMSATKPGIWVPGRVSGLLAGLLMGAGLFVCRGVGVVVTKLLLATCTPPYRRLYYTVRMRSPIYKEHNMVSYL